MRFRGCLLALVLLGLSSALVAAPMTYQGQLDRSGSPYSGQVDMEFALYDAASGGSQVTGAISKSSVPVEKGVFSVSLDFGDDVFDGSARYLAVSVDGSELSPRQQVGSVPVAQFALSGGDGSVFQRSGDNAFFNEGSVSIGTSEFLSSPPGLYVQSGSSEAIHARSNETHPLHLYRQGAEGQDSNTASMMEMWRSAWDEPEPGMGAGMDFRLQVSNGGFTRTGAIESVMVSPENADAKADLVFRTRNNDDGTFPTERLRLTHDNQVQISGDLSFADATLQKTAGPIAKGVINADGSIENAVNVASASWDEGGGWYRIEISGESYFFNRYVAQITPMTGPEPVRTSSQNGDLIVEFADSQQHSFQLVVYSLPNGVVTHSASVKASEFDYGSDGAYDDDVVAPTGSDLGQQWDGPEAIQSGDPAFRIDALARRLNALEAENRMLRHQARRSEQLEERLELLEAVLLDGGLDEVVQ